MKYYKVRPEVPANFVGGTRDRTQTPPRVTSVDLEFEFPLRSEIITAINAFVVTVPLAEALRATDFTGFRFGPVTSTAIATYVEEPDKIMIPPLECLVVTGTALHDDFGVAASGNLVVSERAARFLIDREPTLRAFELDTDGNTVKNGVHVVRLQPSGSAGAGL